MTRPGGCRCSPFSSPFSLSPPRRVHPREELADRLWPDDEAEVGRANVRQALASLRRQLELPPTPAGSVFFADRAHILLLPGAFVTDVAEFEACVAAASAESLARACLCETMEIKRALHDKIGVAYTLKGFGELAQTQERDARAARLYAAALTLSET